MEEGELLLTLDDGCIETTARRLEQRLTRALLDGPADAAAATALELLTHFLQTADFRSLRARDPDLAGASGAVVRLRRGTDGSPQWTKLGHPDGLAPRSHAPHRSCNEEGVDE